MTIDDVYKQAAQANPETRAKLLGDHGTRGDFDALETTLAAKQFKAYQSAYARSYALSLEKLESLQMDSTQKVLSQLERFRNARFKKVFSPWRPLVLRFCSAGRRRCFAKC
jgi:hypothetical protein